MTEKTTENDLSECIKQLRQRALDFCYDDYLDFAHIDYDTLIIENLMCNGRCHLVAVFKNYLIEDDRSEYLRRFYKKKESNPRLKKLFAYHDETSVIFPNYVPLTESKYLYNNVIKKQRVIDEQQSLDKIRNDHKLKKLSAIKKEERMFNSTIFGEILTSNRSVIRLIFGLDQNDKKYGNNGDININDDSGCKDFIKIIKEVEKAEEKADNIKDNSLEGFNLTNKASKYKLKLGYKLNSDIRTKNQNKYNDKQYNMTNNSTNITSISNNNINNNINNNTNLKKYKNNNLSIKDVSLQTHSNLKVNKKAKNISLNKTSPNKKNSEDKNNIINRNYNNQISSKTLYGLNFHSNNKIINSLINKEKKINLKSKSNNSHHQINDKVKSSIFNNNYIYNNNFPQNLKINERNINLYNNRNNKLSLIVKSYNDTIEATQIPKIDMNKVKLLNNNIQVNNKFNSNTNRNYNNRNNNYILNNPNLFFTETEVLKSERNIINKKNLKKETIKSKFGPILTFSPLKLSSKILVGKNNISKHFSNKEKIFKSMNHRNIKVNQYLSNNSNINQHQNNKSKKNLVINEYNHKAIPKINPEQNYFNRIFKK